MAENENKIVQEEMKEEELQEQRVDFFSYYRRLSLETISPIDNKQLFEPRIYRKKVSTFMAENKSDVLMPEIRS